MSTGKAIAALFKVIIDWIHPKGTCPFCELPLMLTINRKRLRCPRCFYSMDIRGGI